MAPPAEGALRSARSGLGTAKSTSSTRGARSSTPIDLVAFIERNEQLRRGPHRLGAAQHQQSVGLEPVMEDREDAALEQWLQINEDVPAADEIEVRERRVSHDVVSGEDAEVADPLGDSILPVLLHEEAPRAAPATRRR